ncbi:hypothetical protein Cni_G11823 [Canna indica]|uniref:Uncharacterized protein n=1 Tax=Canna indica TaxID=4628 RepID=A0AAQ3QBK1_9LILI|nr:hypothetical protein Cni_G11823 [Canna indica]
MTRRLSHPPMLIHSPSGSVPTLPSPVLRRQPLILREKPKANVGERFAEVAGQTTAECTAVLCCCPCGLANLIYAAAIKLPAGLVRRALRGKRKHRIGYLRKNGGYFRNRVSPLGDDDDEFNVHPGTLWVALRKDDGWPTVLAASPELVALEKEMSARFSSAGFWRSLSQKEM